MVVVSILVALILSALAHPQMVRSTPAPGAITATAPTEVRLFFDEELDPRRSVLFVYQAATGVLVDLGDGGVDLDVLDRNELAIRLQQPLLPGDYVVKWIAIGTADRGFSEGGFMFTVEGTQ